jgi:hypothetical protein
MGVIVFPLFLISCSFYGGGQTTAAIGSRLEKRPSEKGRTETQASHSLHPGKREKGVQSNPQHAFLSQSVSAFISPSLNSSPMFMSAPLVDPAVSWPGLGETLAAGAGVFFATASCFSSASKFPFNSVAAKIPDSAKVCSVFLLFSRFIQFDWLT